MKTEIRLARLAAVCGAALFICVGPAHADVVIDLGRGPVTVHVPPIYDPSLPAPLVVLLHHYGGSGVETERYMDLLPWSNRAGFLYVFPDGLRDQAGDRFWNATDACCDRYDTGIDDSGYLRALIDEIVAQLSVDTERVYLLGYSNGGFMAYRMACDHADIIAAVASLAGATWADPDDCTPSAPVRTLQIHGTADNVIRYHGGFLMMGTHPGAVETTEQWATYNQCSMVPDLSLPPLDLGSMPGFETTVARYADDCEPGGSSELWTIVGGTHRPTLSANFTPLVLDFFFSGGGGDLPTHRQLIPAAAYAAGAEGAFFQTDVEINNKGMDDASVWFWWLPRGTDNSDPVASTPITLSPGESLQYPNALNAIFGLDPDSVGAIAMVSDSMYVIGMSRTYNTPVAKAAGTFGQALPAVPYDELIMTGEIQRIIFMSEDIDFRANLGCINGTAMDITVDIELFDDLGQPLETIAMGLSPYSNKQINRIFRAYMPVNGYVDVSSAVADAAFYCYGSVLDNETSDPTTALPQVPSHTNVFIPAAALAAGAEGAFFQTDVDLNNTTDSAVTYTFKWLPRGLDNSAANESEQFSLSGSIGVRLENVLTEVFGLEPDSLGALSIETSSPDLLAMSRTYNIPGAKLAGTFGQALPGVHMNQMIPSGEKKRIIFMTENDEFRANLGCVNGAAFEVTVKIDMFDSHGEKLARKVRVLAPYSSMQINKIFESYAPVQGYVDVWTDTAGAYVYCYGSVLDNETSDPTTVLPQ